MDLVDELIELRASKGVSQTAVAQATGCDQSAVSLWEQKKTKPSGSARILLERYVKQLRKMADKASAA